MKLTLLKNKEGELIRFWSNHNEVSLSKVRLVNLDIKITDKKKLVELSLNNKMTLDDVSLILTIVEPETIEDINNLEILIKEMKAQIELKKELFLNKGERKWTV